MNDEKGEQGLRPAPFKSIFLWSLVFKSVLCLLMLLAVLSYWIFAVRTYGMSSGYWILSCLILPGIVVPMLVYLSVRNDNISVWTPWLFRVESLFTIWVAFLFFSEPMHDIALDFFGHHGRFGVPSFEGRSYLINDVTLPLILFVPPLISGLVFFRWKR